MLIAAFQMANKKSKDENDQVAEGDDTTADKEEACEESVRFLSTSDGDKSPQSEAVLIPVHSKHWPWTVGRGPARMIDIDITYV
jgi:hypothetical protein